MEYIFLIHDGGIELFQHRQPSRIERIFHGDGCNLTCEEKRVGGGDIKMLAATACWFTAKGALQLLTAVLLSGGVLALTFLAVRMTGGRKVSSNQQVGIPYAVAIAIGAALQVWQYRYW